MSISDTPFPNLPPRISGLAELAENLWWSWDPAARMLFKTLSRQAWKASVHNPDRLLREVPTDLLTAAAVDPAYLDRYDRVMARFRHYMNTARSSFPGLAMPPQRTVVAYFSAEYGLHRSLPFYAGGLGFLAGDFLKECSDLCIPLVAVGFMYPEGYLRQKIRNDGWQDNVTETLDREAAPINRVLDGQGNPLVVRVPVIDPPIFVGVWKVAVGRVDLFLMDTDIPANSPWNRGISARLYIGDVEQRLRQEIVLGIGGAEVLKAIGHSDCLLHLNEGHAAFVLLERVRSAVAEGRCRTFEAARERVRRSSVFTTHTPVAAGHDVFPFHLMEAYFRSYWPTLGIGHDAFMDLGIHPDRPDAGFNMTVLAMNLCAYRNAVSRRHGEVSRRMWQGLSKGPAGMETVTNGVHVATWVEPKIRLLLDHHLGEGWLDAHDDPGLWQGVRRIPDGLLWRTHYWLKIKLIDAVRELSRRRWSEEGAAPSSVLSGGALLDPSVLTIGFARRFTTYKRADLILQDRERLKKLLNDRWRPIQIIFAGKAHPSDDPGRQLLQRVFNAGLDPEMGGRIAFVEDYGEQLAQYMVHGVDVWLNNPLPPMEACGTSGMKAALNGVPQLSILDGWWLEGYNGKNGWAFLGGGEGSGADAADAAEIYRLLETEIIPLYYRTSASGVPLGWVQVMKAAMIASGARFSARRMVKEYLNRFYAPALEAERASKIG